MKIIKKITNRVRGVGTEREEGGKMGRKYHYTIQPVYMEYVKCFINSKVENVLKSKQSSPWSDLGVIVNSILLVLTENFIVREV